MITIIVTASNEAESVVNALKFLVNSKYSGYQDEIELIQVSPDDPTLKAAKAYINELNNPKLKFIQIKDSGKSKPAALNEALKEATNQTIVLTDGDVVFEQNSLKVLVENFVNNNFDIACGKPVSINPRNKFINYISHLMTAAADDKRSKSLMKTEFFPLSGYMLILNKYKYEVTTNNNLELPEDCLVEDAYISYLYFNSGLKLGYIPDAEVKVKFPSTLSDYFKQKKRSTGGYLQLWKYNIVDKSTNSRSFEQELKYIFFPIKFAENFSELVWSLWFYPIRLYLWILMWLERKVFNKDFEKTWVRVESTK